MIASASFFVGSSFTCGHSWAEGDVFTASAATADPTNPSVINLSVIDGSHESALETLRVAAAGDFRFEKVVVEINGANTRASLLATPASTEAARAISLPSPLFPQFPYFDFFLRHPMGVGFFAAIFDQYNYPPAERDAAAVPLNDSYFLTVDTVRNNEAIVRKLMEDTVEATSAVSVDVSVFFSPVLLSLVPETGHDPQPVANAYGALVALCEEQPSIRCLDFGSFQNRAHFGDVSHLNKRGGEAFAKALFEKGL